MQLPKVVEEEDFFKSGPHGVVLLIFLEICSVLLRNIYLNSLDVDQFQKQLAPDNHIVGKTLAVPTCTENGSEREEPGQQNGCRKGFLPPKTSLSAEENLQNVWRTISGCGPFARPRLQEIGSLYLSQHCVLP